MIISSGWPINRVGPSSVTHLGPVKLIIDSFVSTQLIGTGFYPCWSNCFKTDLHISNTLSEFDLETLWEVGTKATGLS